MSDRSFQILEAVIRRFINSGEPVSSDWLFENHNFGIRPAMIRWELTGLTDEGYLKQPHHSAGRVPADKGYEYFAEAALAHAEPTQREKALLSIFENQSWDELLSRLAEDLGVLAVAVDPLRGELYKSHLEHLIDGLEWDTHEELRSVIRDFSRLEERVRELERLREGEISFSIGKKTPLTESKNVSVMFTSCGGPEGMYFFAIGPKRMPYEETARVLKTLRNAKPSSIKKTKSKKT